MATEGNFFKENGYTDTVHAVLASSSSSSSSSSLHGQDLDQDEALDYNEAFPRLASATGLSRAHYEGDNNDAAVTNMKKLEDDLRRKILIHEKLATTKIIEIPPEDRLAEKSSRNGSSRQMPGSSSNNHYNGYVQKLCTRIQKETSANITFFYKDQTLILTITGRPEQVRSAQIHILHEIQRPVKIEVNIPSDFHRFILGPRGTTLKQLELETSTRIAVPGQESRSNKITITGAKDNVKLAEQKVIAIYHTQFNKGYERLSIPAMYHPWIRHDLADEIQREYHVTIDLPPPSKQIDTISIRGERQPVEQARIRILQYFQTLEGKIIKFPLEIPCDQHRFVLGKKGAGLKEIFDKTHAFVRIPNQEEKSSTIEVIGEMSNVGAAITMICQKASALTAVKIESPQWMHSVVKGDRSANLDLIRKTFPDVRIYFHDNYIDVEGPPEQVEPVRSQIQTVIDDLRNSNTTYLEIQIDPQYYKQLIGKNQIRLTEIQDQTGCDIKFPPEGSRNVKLLGSKESVEKARQILLERVARLANERTVSVSIDPQFYPQIIGVKGKKLEELRGKFHNIQIRFPQPDDKSDKVTLQGDKEDVEKCMKFLQQKIKDFYSVEFDVPRRFYPLLIGKSGSNIQRLRDAMPEIRVDIPALEDNKQTFSIRLSGKKVDVDKGKKQFDEHIEELKSSLENSIEQTVTIDPKWHSRFFQNNRKLLIDLQKQYGDLTIKIPEKKSQSDQILLRGPKEIIENVEKHLQELVDKWENTVTKEMTIPHRHHGYLLAQGGSYIQPIQKEFDVQIKFPTKDKESTGTKDDTVKIIGRLNDVEKASQALEKMIPLETTIEIPNEVHGSLVGKGASHLQDLLKLYPDVQVTFPPIHSALNTIRFKGQADQVQAFQKELLERYEKYQADRQARSYELPLTVKSDYRQLILGHRRTNITNLKKQYEVQILIGDHTTPPSAVVPTPSASNGHEENKEEPPQAIPHDHHTDEEQATAESNHNHQDLKLIIKGYEDRAVACRDAILRLIEEFQSKITMVIEIDRRVHARIIGSGGNKLQQMMKEFDVEIKFPSVRSDEVYVSGLNQQKIDDCIDRLLTLEENFLQDLPIKHVDSNTLSQYQQQEVPSLNRIANSKSTEKNNKQAPFKVKNAPWTSAEQDEDNGEHQGKRNGHPHSPKKVVPAPNPRDLVEYPSIPKSSLTGGDENSGEIVKPIPVRWGPAKSNK